MYKIFLTNSFVSWQNNGKLLIHYINIISIVAYATVQYSKTSVTHKCNLGLKISWKVWKKHSRITKWTFNRNSFNFLIIKNFKLLFRKKMDLHWPCWADVNWHQTNGKSTKMQCMHVHCNACIQTSRERKGTNSWMCDQVN